MKFINVINFDKSMRVPLDDMAIRDISPTINLKINLVDWPWPSFQLK